MTPAASEGHRGDPASVSQYRLHPLVDLGRSDT